MEFCFSPEQEQFRESLARFLRDRSPTTAIRKLMETDTGHDPVVWRQLCGELGLAGLHLPEEVGGSGYGPVELGIAMEEQGRALLCAPYLASAVMAGYAILLAGSEDQRANLLPAIAEGSTIAALAITESAGLWGANDIRLSATPSADGFSLRGRKRFVVDGQNAGLLVVAGRTGSGVSLFAVDAGAEGVTRRAMAPMDATRRLAEIDFAGTPAQLLGTEGGAPLDAILDAVLIALAHEMIGGAQALLDSAVAYARLRVQFGRPIGSFQAIKHRCADLLVQVELAKAAVYQAAQLMADGAGRNDVTLAASQAKAVASEAYMRAARECIQFHGGIGFTWENDTHLWFKRAKSSEVFLGSPREHRERMLQAMGV
jgi:alkylation response protein AidB-like acyl-CoA dehydrogenase